MRPTGAMHLGHYHGALKNWVKMQSERPCLFFVARLARTDDPLRRIRKHRAKYLGHALIDWLAAGVDPSQSTLFIQSHVPRGC